MNGQPERLTIAVGTFHRVTDLLAVVPMLCAQAREAMETAAVDVDILVVDNDPEGSGADAVDALHLAEVDTVVEPRPGISAVRNRALDKAADSDLLVFIDDDERPEPGWLVALLDTWRASKPAGVVGPVESRFAVPPEPWVIAGEFFARRSRASTRTGQDIDRGATNNLLLDLTQIRRFGLRFDEAFGISGGGDTHFTTGILAHGGRLVWCREAVVSEVVPASRLTRKWLLTRALSYGTTDSRVRLSRAEGVRQRAAVRLWCWRQGLPRIGVGGARWLLGTALRSDRHNALGLQTMLRGAGLVAGSFGYAYHRYRRAAVKSTEVTAAAGVAGDVEQVPAG